MPYYDKPQGIPLNEDRDAARWAKEFFKATLGTHVDEGTMIGWFANAMMCGEDTYRWREEAKAVEKSEHAPRSSVAGSSALADKLDAALGDTAITSLVRQNRAAIVSALRSARGENDPVKALADKLNEADAARYRWLRSEAWINHEGFIEWGSDVRPIQGTHPCTAEYLDAALDAMRGEYVEREGKK